MRAVEDCFVRNALTSMEGKSPVLVAEIHQDTSEITEVSIKHDMAAMTSL